MKALSRVLGVAAVAAILCGSVSLPAQAQLIGAGEGGGTWGDGIVRRGTPVQALPTPYSQGGSCVQWCVADATPCDPDYFKVADRRCNVNLNGYFPK